MNFKEFTERLKWKLLFRKTVVYYEWGTNIKIGERAQVVSLSTRKGKDRLKKVHTGVIVDRDFETGRFETKKSVYLLKKDDRLKALLSRELPLLTEEVDPSVLKGQLNVDIHI